MDKNILKQLMSTVPCLIKINLGNYELFNWTRNYIDKKSELTKTITGDLM
jgi:hypothetical protein